LYSVVWLRRQRPQLGERPLAMWMTACILFWMMFIIHRQAGWLCRPDERGPWMSDGEYIRDRTGLILIDPYNESLGEAGQVWRIVRDVTPSVRLHEHLRQVLDAVRAAHSIVTTGELIAALPTG
jgi:hypothetical protein